MYSSAPRFTFLLVVALSALVTPRGVAAQVAGHDPSPGRARSGEVRGTVVDVSDGVLPGVSVVASVDGQPLHSTVTSVDGGFRFEGLRAGVVELHFRLDGFGDSTETVIVHPRDPADGGPSAIKHRMELLSLAESVHVRGDPPPPPPPPRPVVEPVPDHDQASVCGPARAESLVPAFGTIRSRRTDEAKVLFAAGDELLIDGGTSTGLAVGANFVVRRRYPTALRYGRNLIVMGEHSSGLLQIISADAQMSTAVVVYACDEMMRGDYLVPFEPEPVRAPDPAGTPVFDDAVRILFADAGEPLGVTGRMMVIDRGAREDVRTGQRLTLFRRSRFGDARPIVVGEAVVVAVGRDSATIRVDHATDAIFFGENGDWAAPHRPLVGTGN